MIDAEIQAPMRSPLPQCLRASVVFLERYWEVNHRETESQSRTGMERGQNPSAAMLGFEFTFWKISILG